MSDDDWGEDPKPHGFLGYCKFIWTIAAGWLIFGTWFYIGAILVSSRARVKAAFARRRSKVGRDVR